MKIFTCICAIYITTLINIFCQESIFDGLDYYRVFTNYNGSAYNGRSILVYGEGGVIVRSTDGGNSWQQTNLNDSFNIKGMVNMGINYYGLVNNKYIIKSMDDGITWELREYDIDTNSKKLINDEFSIYCITESKIISYDKNIVRREEFPIKTDTNYYDFTKTGFKLIYSAGHGKLGIIDLQYLEVKTSTIDLKDLGICVDCPVVKNLFSDGKLTYFTLNKVLYQYDGSKVELIHRPIHIGNYAGRNNDVFELYNVTDPLINLDSLYFIKINKSTQKDIQIKKPGNDRYISSLKFSNISFLTKDTIIAVGKDKLIYMSYDGGVNWHIKSHFNYSTEWGDIFLFNSLSANRISNYAKFVKTTDGGITWLPQKNYDPRFITKEFDNTWNFGHTYFRDNNNGFVWSNTKIYLDINFIYTNDGCTNVKLKNVDGTSYPLSRDVITFSNQDITLMSFPSVWYAHAYTYLWNINDTLGVMSKKKIDSALVLFMDKFDNEELYSIILNLKYPRKSGEFSWAWDSVYCSLISSNDAGATWQNQLDFVLPNSNYDFNSVTHLNDNIIFSYYDRITDKTTYYCEFYKLNIRTKILEKILSKKKMDMNSMGITGRGNKIYVNSSYSTDTGLNYELLVCDDIVNKPAEWRSITPISRYGYHFINIKNDSLIYIIGYDSLMKSQVIWFAKPKNITSVDDNIETTPALYISTPKPNPARDYVKIKVWWDKGYNFDNVVIKVYDLLGILVSDNSHIVFNKLNSYSGELALQTEGLNTGIYFISITLGGETRIMPVIISR